MFGAILKATNSSFQKGMIFGRSIYVKKVMKLLAFIFEQPSYAVPETICSLMLILNYLNYLILILPTVYSPENDVCFYVCCSMNPGQTAHKEIA